MNLAGDMFDKVIYMDNKGVALIDSASKNITVYPPPKANSQVTGSEWKEIAEKLANGRGVTAPSDSDD